MKGAFSGVVIEVLIRRLREARLPEILVKVIQDFCSNRKATVVVNGSTTNLINLQHAGLPQGSPLSPILFLFFNANLVKSPINKCKGSIAFVDDYSAWVTDDSIQANTIKLQNHVIPHLEQWGHTSGAIFQPTKTVLTHFTRRRKALEAADANSTLVINSEEVKPSGEIKILGVTLDSRLTYKSHIARAMKKGLRVALALKRLHNIRPEVARQLYTATVTSRTDYASIIWAPNATATAMKGLERVQRIGAQAVISAFKTVSLVIAEAEAGLERISTRLHRQYITTWVKLHSKSKTHRFWKIKKALGDLRNQVWISPLQKIARICQNIIPGNLEYIQPFTKAPWISPVEVHLLDKEKAIEEASIILPTSVFTSASSRNNLIGVGICWFGVSSMVPLNKPAESISITIATAKELNVHAGELTAIQLTVSRLLFMVMMESCQLQVTVFSSSQGALKALQKPCQQSGQFIINRIITEAHMINASGKASVRFQWSPGHSDISGNDLAHTLAQQATEVGQSVSSMYNQPVLQTTALRIAKQIQSPKDESFNNPKTGRFTKVIDKALPGKHTRLLYDKKPHSRASILCQLRSGICRLNSYLFKIKAAASPYCECGVTEESVDHFLFRCTKWREQRTRLREISTKAGRWDTSFFLGGWSGVTIDGVKDKWKPALDAVTATLDFAISTKRLCAEVSASG